MAERISGADAGAPRSAELQRTRNITITGPGLAMLAARAPRDVTRQVNIINSTVEQLALGNISNIDVFVILDAAERALDQIDAPAAVCGPMTL
jgi:hypothetical protein